MGAVEADRRRTIRPSAAVAGGGPPGPGSLPDLCGRMFMISWMSLSAFMLGPVVSTPGVGASPSARTMTARRGALMRPAMRAD